MHLSAAIFADAIEHNVAKNDEPQRKPCKNSPSAGKVSGSVGEHIFDIVFHLRDSKLYRQRQFVQIADQRLSMT